MKEGYKGEDAPRLPQQQQAQQTQPGQGEGDAALFHTIGTSPDAMSAPAGDDDNDKDKGPAFDNARLENGLGDFYTAVLKEPVPEKMLRLIEQLAKREQE